MTKNLTTSNFYVYGHYRNDTKELFYVGKGKSQRAWDKRRRNTLWNRIVKKADYGVFILYQDLSEEDAFRKEKALILDLSPIANFSKGGAGGYTLLGKSEKEKKAIYAKQSMAVSGKKHPQYGKPKPKVTREKIAKTLSRISVKVVCNETGEVFNSISECARKLNINKANLGRLKKGTRKSLKGLTFKFIEPKRSEV